VALDNLTAGCQADTRTLILAPAVKTLKHLENAFPLFVVKTDLKAVAWILTLGAASGR
jgi:hypothetical protein